MDIYSRIKKTCLGKRKVHDILSFALNHVLEHEDIETHLALRDNTIDIDNIKILVQHIEERYP